MVMKQNKKNHQHPNRNWFSASIPEIERELKTNISVGLTEAEAATRLQNNGKNKLDAVKNKSWFMILLSCLVEPLNLVLAVAAIISLVVPLVFNEFTFAEGIECGVIVFTILANSLLGTIQEVKTHSSINALQKNTTLKNHCHSWWARKNHWCCWSCCWWYCCAASRENGSGRYSHI
jgi:magnesium-transporting ATPase (P-type)